MKSKKVAKKPVKKCACTKDCNIMRIQETAKVATLIAIEDYKNGDLAKDPCEQIGRVLFAMQKEFNTPAERKRAK